MRRFTAFAAIGMLCVLSSCSSCGDKGSPLGPETEEEKKPDVTYQLHVTLPEGVSGAPSHGTHTYKAGERVSYSYTADTGFHHEYVVLDSTVVSASGTFVMDTIRHIFAGVEKKRVVAPEDEPARQAAQAVLTSTDRVDAAQKYVEELKKLFVQYSSAEALARAQAVSQSIYSEASLAEVQAMHSSLDGEMFLISPPVPAGLQASYTDRAYVSVFYTNGMTVGDADALLATVDLMNLLWETDRSFPLPIYLFYNSSVARNLESRIFCYITLGLGCIANYGADFAQASTQLLSVLSGIDALALSKSVQLAGRVKEAREKGHVVVLVGHSQGTLIIQEALRKLGSADPCIATLSLAGPDGVGKWDVVSEHRTGFTQKGDSVWDIILNLGLNDFPTLKTSETRDADRALAKAWFMPLYERLKQELRLHSFKSYLAHGSESRALVASRILEQAKILAYKPGCKPEEPPPPPPPTLERIYASSGSGASAFGPSNLWIVPAGATGVDSLVGRIREQGGYQPLITDLATHPSGQRWATSFDGLYTVDTLTALATEVVRYPSGMSGMNALTFDKGGRLFAANAYTDKIIGMSIEPLNIFWNATLGGGLRTGGDMEFSPQGVLYATVRKGTSGNSMLALIDLSRDTNVASVICDDLGFQDVWGLKYVGDTLYGLTASSTGKGELVTIDPHACVTTRVRQLAFSAYGAALRR